MPSPAPATHARAHKGRLHHVWVYTIHYSPVSPSQQFGVSRDGVVKHRARSLARAVDWAVDQAEIFYNRNARTGHPLLASARSVLEQHGRTLNVAQA